jgi:hypothetical protein
MMPRGAHEIFEGLLIVVVGFVLWDVTREPLCGILVLIPGTGYVFIGFYRMYMDRDNPDDG